MQKPDAQDTPRLGRVVHSGQNKLEDLAGQSLGSRQWLVP